MTYPLSSTGMFGSSGSCSSEASVVLVVVVLVVTAVVVVVVVEVALGIFWIGNFLCSFVRRGVSVLAFVLGGRALIELVRELLSDATGVSVGVLV